MRLCSILGVLGCAGLLALSSCSPRSTDLRTLAPADALIYLQTNDLGAALRPLAESRPAQAIDGSRPDFSSFDGVQLAIVVNGFETSEKKLNEEQSSAQVKPNFVAITDTHAWHFQAVRFAEEKLGSLVAKFYGDKPQMDDPEHNGGRDITWTAADGRKAFAFVIGSVVYFSNDRASLDKVLTVRSGAANLASTGKAASSGGALATGYVSQNGIGQLSDLVAIRVAAAGSEDPQVRSAVASVLPPLAREMVEEVRWSADMEKGKVVDTYDITIPESVRSALVDGQVDDLNLRLRNAVFALLRESKLDEKTRAEVADIVASVASSGAGDQTTFTPTGLQRKTASESGLIGQIVLQFSGG